MSDVIMDGVWIINVRQETDNYDLRIFLGIVIGIFVALITEYILLRITDESDFCGELLFPLLIICAIAGAGIASSEGSRTDTGNVVYDVMIGDNVPFNEFTEQYEIIKQNGNIYTVKEKKQ